MYDVVPIWNAIWKTLKLYVWHVYICRVFFLNIFITRETQSVINVSLSFPVEHRSSFDVHFSFLIITGAKKFTLHFKCIGLSSICVQIVVLPSSSVLSCDKYHTGPRSTHDVENQDHYLPALVYRLSEKKIPDQCIVCGMLFSRVGPTLSPFCGTGVLDIRHCTELTVSNVSLWTTQAIWMHKDIEHNSLFNCSIYSILHISIYSTVSSYIITNRCHLVHDTSNTTIFTFIKIPYLNNHHHWQ